MRHRVLLVVVALAWSAAPASAGAASGELASDAPVELHGTATADGVGLVLLHHAYQDGSLSVVLNRGNLREGNTLHTEPSQPSECQTFDGMTEEEPVLTVDATRPDDRVTVRLLQGALGQLEPRDGLRFAVGDFASTPAPDQATAHLGPNPYTLQAQQQAFSGTPADDTAPAFPLGAFLVAPVAPFNTIDPFLLSVFWGRVEVERNGDRVTHEAGLLSETRQVPNEDALPLEPEFVDCNLRVIRTLVLDAPVAVTSVGQAGLDRLLGFWEGAEVEEAFGQGQTVPPQGYWERERDADFATALEKLHLPATLATAADLRLEIQGAAHFENALGIVAVDGDLHEAKNEPVQLGGRVGLTPTASQDGRRMTTRIGEDVSSVSIGASEKGFWPTAAPFLLGAGAGVAALGVAFVAWPTVKFGATRIALFPLYARLKREDILENPLRDDILEAVGQSPGISASDLGRRLNCGWGTLVYHLTVLERMQLLSSAREGRHRRFFVQGRINYSDKGAVGLLANPAARVILDAIKTTPGMIQRDLSRRVNLSAGTVAWHVDRLAEAGLILKEEEGRVVRYYPSQKLIELTKETAA